MHNGDVVNRAGTELHYISSDRLISLYGLNPAECIPYKQYEQQHRNYFNVAHLYPKRNGNYVI